MKKTLALLLASLLLGCGGGSTPAADEGGEGGAGGEAAPLPTVSSPWESMSARDRAAFMGQAVVPVMRERFQAYDGERFASFGCGTCHGADAAGRGFAMPNPDLMPLPTSGTPEQREMVRQHPEMTRFMFNEVLPTVREMLGLPEFDAATGEGFSCFHCHTRLEASGAEDEGGAVEADTPEDGASVGG